MPNLIEYILYASFVLWLVCCALFMFALANSSSLGEHECLKCGGYIESKDLGNWQLCPACIQEMQA